MKKSYLLLLLPLLIFSLRAYATIHNVQVSDFKFTPASLTVSVGDTIKWTWVGGAHTTTSEAIPAAAASWNHAMNQSSQTFLYKVTVPGLYNYVCTPHAPNMAGSFIASPVSGTSGPEAAAPSFVLKGSVVSEEIIIDLDIVHAAQVNIRLYNLLGRLVRTYNDSRRETGTYQENYPVGDLPKGLYLLSVEVGNQHTTRRVIIE